MKKLNEKISYFEIARIVAIVSVILMHSSAQVLFEFEPVMDIRWWLGNFIASSTHWAVPLFFMISGALHLGKPLSIKSFYLKKTKRIVFPLLIWIGAYAVFNHFYRGDPLSLTFILNRILRDQPYEHLYFLFILFELFLLTPLFNWLLHRYAHHRYHFWFVMVLVTLLWNPGRSIFTVWIPFVSYYLAGYLLLNVRMTWSSSTLSKLLVGSVCLTMIGTALLTRQIIPNKDGFYFFSYGSPLTMLIACCAFLLFKKEGHRLKLKNERVVLLASAVFGVFLIHQMFIVIAQLLATTLSIGIELTAFYVLFTFLYTTIGSFLIVIYGNALLKIVQAKLQTH